MFVTGRLYDEVKDHFGSIQSESTKMGPIRCYEPYRIKTKPAIKSGAAAMTTHRLLRFLLSTSETTQFSRQLHRRYHVDFFRHEAE